MTGMGDDGAEGLYEMKEAGAATIARTKQAASCLECRRRRSPAAPWTQYAFGTDCARGPELTS